MFTPILISLHWRIFISLHQENRVMFLHQCIALNHFDPCRGVILFILYVTTFREIRKLCISKSEIAYLSSWWILEVKNVERSFWSVVVAQNHKNPPIKCLNILSKFFTESLGWVYEKKRAGNPSDVSSLVP